MGASQDMFMHTVLVLVYSVSRLTCPSFATVISGDYCADKPFSATCGRDEVIMMESARYGRMGLGECVAKDLGFLGCQKDVLPVLDRLCSGKHTCEFPITTTLVALNPCPELTSFLQVDYSCLKVTTAFECEKNADMELRSATSGYLSNVVSQQTGCGSVSSPWIIAATPFQTVNFTLLDFSALNSPTNSWSAPCSTYATVEELDLGEVFIICGGQKRKGPVYRSKGSRVRIILNPPEENGLGQFLLQYEVTGCKARQYPDDMWTLFRHNQLTVGCKSTEKEWKLTCQDGMWRGKVGNCTQESSPGAPHFPGGLQNLPDEIVIVVIVSIALVISTGIVVCGIWYIKRRNRMLEQTALPDPFPADSMQSFSGHMLPSVSKVVDPDECQPATPPPPVRDASQYRTH